MTIRFCAAPTCNCGIVACFHATKQDGGVLVIDTMTRRKWKFTNEGFCEAVNNKNLVIGANKFTDKDYERLNLLCGS